MDMEFHRMQVCFGILNHCFIKGKAPNLGEIHIPLNTRRAQKLFCFFYQLVSLGESLLFTPWNSWGIKLTWGNIYGARTPGSPWAWCLNVPHPYRTARKKLPPLLEWDGMKWILLPEISRWWHWGPQFQKHLQYVQKFTKQSTQYVFIHLRRICYRPQFQTLS